MTVRRVVAGIATALLLAGCSHGNSTVTPVGRTSAPNPIRTVVNRIHCTGYQRDPVMAPGSEESGSCDLPGGVTAQLYLMPSRKAGSYLVDLANENGVKTVKWYGNVLVVTS